MIGNVRLLPLCLWILLSLISTMAVAQTTYNGRVIDEKGVPIQDVNVLLYLNQSSLAATLLPRRTADFR